MQTFWMKQDVKNLASKSQLGTALDIAIKNMEKIKKLQTFDLSHFTGRMYFGNDESQNHLTFRPISNTFRLPTGNSETIIAWKSKAFSDESIKSPTTLILKPKSSWNITDNFHEWRNWEKFVR